MVYSFEFRIRNGYEFAFNALLKGIYPFRFYGFTVYEIYKYALKMVEGVEEISPPPSKIASVKVPIKKLYDTIYKTMYVKELDTATSTRIAADENTDVNSLEIFSETLKDVDVEQKIEGSSNSTAIMDFGQADTRENKPKTANLVSGGASKIKTKSVIRDMIKDAYIRRLVVMNLIYSDIATKSIALSEACDLIEKLSSKTIDINSDIELFDIPLSFTEQLKKHADKIKPLGMHKRNRNDFNRHSYRRISLLRETQHLKRKHATPLDKISRYSMDAIVKNTAIEGNSELYKDVYMNPIEKLLSEYRKFLEKYTVKELAANSTMSVIDNIVADIADYKAKEVESLDAEVYLKELFGVLLTKSGIDKKNHTNSVDREDTKPIDDRSGKQASIVGNDTHKDPVKRIDPVSPVIKIELKDTHAIVKTRKNKLKSTYTVNRTRKAQRKYACTVHSTFKNKYKDLRFYKRWRYRTGTAHDKIWLNPQKEYFLKFEEKENTVEAIISFKAMLDFILFVEQILYVNKDHFSACIPEHAIDRFVDILIEWITEARPQNEVSNEYEYLVRWCKWLSTGQKSKHKDDMTLSGDSVLESIRDDMVRYFESRWGGRVVDYGIDGMFIYSKDRSYIDRIRGKKHGSNQRTWGGDMKREYGISENELIWDVEEERKRDNNG